MVKLEDVPCTNEYYAMGLNFFGCTYLPVDSKFDLVLMRGNADVETRLCSTIHNGSWGLLEFARVYLTIIFVWSQTCLRDWVVRFFRSLLLCLLRQFGTLLKFQPCFNFAVICVNGKILYKQFKIKMTIKIWLNELICIGSKTLIIFLKTFKGGRFNSTCWDMIYFINTELTT